MCEASGVCISSSPCRCGAVVPGVLACVHAYIHMRVCVDVYAYICAGVHVCVYMHMRVRPCTRTCARVYMRMHVRAYARMEGPDGGASACLAVSWARVRTHVHVHACARVYAWARMCTACSECYMHFGTGVLGTSAWEGVYVTQVCFYTNVHICDTLTAGCAHVCVCIYVCIWMRVCMDACMRL